MPQRAAHGVSARALTSIKALLLAAASVLGKGVRVLCTAVLAPCCCCGGCVQPCPFPCALSLPQAQPL